MRRWRRAVERLRRPARRGWIEARLRAEVGDVVRQDPGQRRGRSAADPEPRASPEPTAASVAALGKGHAVVESGPARSAGVTPSRWSSTR